MRTILLSASLACLALVLTAAAPSLQSSPSSASAALLAPGETHFTDLRQLTRGGENAEAYWSPDGRELIFQSAAEPAACDQIFRLPAAGGDRVLVSTGKGRTTCSYFTADGERVLYSSTHAAGPECPPPPDRSRGYVWPVYSTYEIWSARPDGSDPRRLTENDAYDAEATVCPRDGSMLFTSTRDGDLELYRMEPDGGHVKRLTTAPGYDGGAFFSPDCSKIVWRASRPRPGAELEDYQRLLGEGLVRPSKLEIWVADADGSDARQITYLDAASFAPSFFPSGDRIVFSSNYGDPQGREFDLWAVDVDGTGLERITFSPGFDGFPMFSPDGRSLAFASNRNQSAPGETNVFVARWAGGAAGAPKTARTSTAAAGTNGATGANSAPGAAATPAPADRFMADVRWLADDAREGRGLGTAGLAESAEWIAARFAELGLAPGGDVKGSERDYLMAFQAPLSLAAGPGTAVAIDGGPLARDSFQPAGFSTSTSSGPVAAETVAAGWGITAPELGVDDYAEVDAKGKIAVVRRFVPPGGPFADQTAERRYGDLRYKAWNAREHGAVGLVVVDVPAAGPAALTGLTDEEPGAPPAPATPADAPLPVPTLDTTGQGGGDAGIPVVVMTRGAGARLFTGEHRVSLAIDLRPQAEAAVNVVGVVRAGAARRLPGAVVIGAHYDHLGLGGQGSMTPGVRDVHNGADDNASGTAALLEIARLLAARREELPRDVWLVAFSAEESGVLGSSAFTRTPPAGLAIGELAGMLNLDMVGRLRNNRLSVLGGESAEEWEQVVDPACERARVACELSGEGYGPSDHMPFYAAGVPVLHFFTGVHEDYHKPSDDPPEINAAGGAQVAAVVADVAVGLAGRPERLTYKAAPPPAGQGDVRSYGASLGMVPDYAGDGRAGVLLSGVRPGSAADKAGLQRGDLLVGLAGSPVRDIHDLMYQLRKAKPGDAAVAVVERDGKRLELPVTFGGSQR